MNPSAIQALLDVLALTPEAPPAETDPSEVVDLAQELTERREPALAHLRRVMGSNPAVLGEGEAILREITARDAAWHAALERARFELGQRMQAARHLRRRTSSSAP